MRPEKISPSSLVDAIDKTSIPRRAGVEIVSERSIHKGLNHVGKAEEKLEAKLTEQ